MTWGKIGKVIRVIGMVAALVGLPVDLVNLVQLIRVKGGEPPGRPVVYEDLKVTDLPDCAFETTFREEAEPAFYLNLFDWLLGIAWAEESAYAKAEFKIWKDLASGGQGSVGVYGFAWGYSFGEMAEVHRKLVDERGLQYLRKRFYFDENGYHAQITMGRLRMAASETQYSGCPVDPDRGRSDLRNVSLPFSCDNLEEVVADRIERITNDTPNRCWVSYRYETDYKAGRVKFNEEYFVWNEEEVYDVGWPAL